MRRNTDNFEARVDRHPKPAKGGHGRFGYSAWIADTAARLAFLGVTRCDHSHKTESAATRCGEKLLADAVVKQTAENQERDERQARRAGARP